MLSGAPLDVDGNLCSSTGKLQAIAIIDILFPMYSVNDIIMAENRNYQVYEVITAPDLST
jgi:hypothetical protein